MKKFIIAILSLCLIPALFLISSYYFQPAKANVVTTNYIKSNEYSIENIRNMITKNCTEPLAVFYCSYVDEKCNEIDTNIIPTVLENHNLEYLDQIYYVNMANPENEIKNVKELKDEFGFSKTPAFVYYEPSETRCYASNTLEWSDKSPITVESLEQWINDSNILKLRKRTNK